MRIGFVICGDLTGRGGSYLYDRHLVRGLARAGHSVDVLNLEKRDYGRDLLNNFSVRLRRWVGKSDLDCLLQDASNHASLFQLNRSLGGKRHFPILSMVHRLKSNRPWPKLEGWFYERIERSYFGGVDGLIFKSDYMRRETEALLGHSIPYVVAPPGGDHIEPASVTPESIERRALEPGPLQLLFLGNVTRAKGLHHLIRALALLPRDAIRLHVVGDVQRDVPYVREIQASVVREGLTQVVTLWGTLGGSALEKRFESCQAMALTSEREGFGISYLEAMGYGLPVLASSYGAAPELLRDGEEGLVVDPKDSAAIAEALHRWADDRSLLSAMGQKARQRFMRHPTWSETASRVGEFMERAALQRRNPSGSLLQEGGIESEEGQGDAGNGGCETSP